MNKILSFIRTHIIQLTFLLTLFVMVPLNTYLNNILEIHCESALIMDFGIIIIFCLIIFSIVNKLFNDKFLTIFNTILLYLTILVFLQGNFINYNLGVMNGTKVEWSNYVIAIIIETIFWVIAGALIFLYKNKLMKYAEKICTFVIVAQLLFVIFTVIPLFGNKMIESKIFNTQEYKSRVQSTTAYTFSKKNNILILVLDAFPTDLFDEVLKSKEGEKVRTDFKDFTYFHNAMGRFPTTVMSVPYIQSGVPYDNTVTMDEYKHNNQQYFIQNKLKNWLYLDNFYPYISDGRESFYAVTIFRHSPIFLKYLLSQGDYNIFTHNLNEEEVDYYNNLKSRINFIDKPIYKYLHLIGVHPGARMNKNITYNPSASLLDTAIGNLNLTEYILAQLKAQNVYDNSMIFIIADHGLSPTNAYKRYSRPIILFKNYNTVQNDMKISDAHVSLGDIPNTIFDILGKPLNPNGLSIVKNIPANREIEFCTYSWLKQNRNSALAKNQLPPLDCSTFIDGKMLSYNKKDSMINNSKKIFSKDIEKILYSMHYYNKQSDSIWLGEDSYIKFYVNKDNYPKENIKITLITDTKKSVVKTITIQDDASKDILAILKYPKKKPMEYSFYVPKSYIKGDGEVKLNILPNKLKSVYHEEYGISLREIIIEIN